MNYSQISSQYSSSSLSSRSSSGSLSSEIALSSTSSISSFSHNAGPSKRLLVNSLEQLERRLFGHEACLAGILVEFPGSNEDKCKEFFEGALQKLSSENFSLSSSDDYEISCPKAISFESPSSFLNYLSNTSLRSVANISSDSCHFALHVVERPPFAFPLLSHVKRIDFPSLPSTATTNVPTLADWDTLWKAWDLVTLGMIPRDMLLQKPIHLRHKCLFYIGHIPTFLDMMLVKTMGGEASEPQWFWNIFERGIDPHVDDPDHCHNHSIVPEADEDWPILETILAFCDRVRNRLVKLYLELQSGDRPINLAIARTLMMTYEHESFHVETLLYMLIQRAGTGTVPPPNFTRPSWTLLADQFNVAHDRLSRSLLPLPTFGPITVTIGHDDSEADDYDEHGNAVEGPEKVVDRQFGWDNESPSRQVKVGAFKAEWNPISNREFEAFWKGEGKGSVALPPSWVEHQGQIMVRTVYGPVSMDVAEHWPVLTAYDDLVLYAKSKGGRIPTEAELRLFIDTYEIGHEGGSNIGFRNWHPVPPTMGSVETAGKGSNGGVWEWTSDAFDTHDGLVPTKLFTGYSTDFFDSKHQIVLGASYATIPRLCRKTLRNFYQHNYPFPWVGARIVYDVTM